MNFFQKLQSFWLKRYGTPDLGILLFIIYFIIFFINLFLNNSLLTWMQFLVVIIIFYRLMSKNIALRRKENNYYSKIKNNIVATFDNLKNRVNSDYIYKKCPKCKTTLRLPLPYKREIKHVKCPNCGRRLTVFAYKYQKVQFIKNKGGIK